MRRSFLLGAGLLILMFLLRLWRYNTSALSRALWYAYYIPMTAVPLVAFSPPPQSGPFCFGYS